MPINGACELIDTFPSFLRYWAEVDREPPERQIERWATEYLAKWPDLLEMQIANYDEQGVQWREVAGERVFPFLNERMPAMQLAHANLVELCLPMVARIEETLGFGDSVIFVIYVGIGCGAGWATEFHHTPAVLLGLEAIAECGWTDREALSGLIAHELGHLVHSSWRLENGKAPGNGPWWDLYEEGFAQECESLVLNSEIVHQTMSRKEQDWLVWCRKHKGGLAAEYLRTIDSGEPTAKFFGSWYEIDGQSETGYFLGQEVIKMLLERLSLKDVALVEDQENILRPVLEQMVHQN